MTLRSHLNTHLQKGRESLYAGLDRGKKYDHNLLPIPRNLSALKGHMILPLSLDYQIQGRGNKDRLEKAIEKLGGHLSCIYGFDFLFTPCAGQAHLTLMVEDVSEQYPTVDVDESYHLTVNSDCVSIVAKTEFGGLRALQSLLQIVEVVNHLPLIPNVEINDKPSLAWRGLLLDVSRHFMPFDLVLKLVDSMAMVKLNVLHFHFTDDQGFRVESKRFPKLHQVGNHGEYYTQEQIKTLVDYSADLGIRVVPEIGIPGHSSAIQIAYPEYSLESYHPKAVNEFVGDFSPPLDVCKEETYDFISCLIEEMIGLFPDNYYHLGGDEAPGKFWIKDQSTRGFMSSRGIKNPHELQAMFTRRYTEIARKFGKQAIVWEDAISDDLPESVVVQTWKEGCYSLDTDKHSIINSWGYYLDFKRPAWSYYRQDPLEFQVNGRDADSTSVIGAEVSMWTESVIPTTLMTMIWPQTLAIAELFWSGHQQTSVIAISDLYRRMDSVGQQMEACGLMNRNSWCEDIRLMAGQGNAQALEILADVIEPAGYHNLRKRSNVPSLLLPNIFPIEFHKSDGSLFLEKLPAESKTAHKFQLCVERYLSGDCRQANRLKQYFEGWQQNHEEVVDTIRHQSALKDEGLELVSWKLSQVASVGLNLLYVLENKQEMSFMCSNRCRRVLDYCEYDIFSLGGGNEHRSFMMGFLKSDSLNRHNIAIQPGVRLLLNACS